MEEKESPESGSVPVSGGGGEMVINTAVNVVNTGGLGGDLMGKKKRGRPRKYDSDGNLRVQYVKSPPPPSHSSSSDYSSKRGRGRPPGSGNWQLLASLGQFYTLSSVLYPLYIFLSLFFRFYKTHTDFAPQICYLPCSQILSLSL